MPQRCHLANYNDKHHQDAVSYKPPSRFISRKAAVFLRLSYKERKTSLMNCRTNHPGADCATDHQLLCFLVSYCNLSRWLTGNAADRGSHPDAGRGVSCKWMTLFQCFSYSLADLGFFRGVTLGTLASEVSEHWGGLGLRENETARIWLKEGPHDIEIT